MGGYRGTPEWRFWRHVDRTDGPDARWCWPWTASRNPLGYGKFGVTSRLTVPAHRFAFEASVGPIPTGLCVLHSCDNPPCCNPAHLFLGDRADNAHDRDSKGRGFPPPHLVGEACGSARLTAVQVLAIRADGRQQRQIALAYGIGKSTVAHIQRRESWRHLQEVS